MHETRFDLQAAGAAEAPVASDQGRLPFVAPSVEEMGGLAELTLISGSL